MAWVVNLCWHHMKDALPVQSKLWEHCRVLAREPVLLPLPLKGKKNPYMHILWGAAGQVPSFHSLPFLPCKRSLRKQDRICLKEGGRPCGFTDQKNVRYRHATCFSTSWSLSGSTYALASLAKNGAAAVLRKRSHAKEKKTKDCTAKN